MWWFAALHGNLLMLSQRRAPIAPRARHLDAGCGTGGFLARLAASCPAKPFSASTRPARLHPRAAKSAPAGLRGSVNVLPFADGAFAAIFSADVLCHDGVDEHVRCSNSTAASQPAAC